MLYELLMGKTPFHSYEMKDLLNKINDGKYSINLREPVTIECALFLAETLQFEEKERISDSNLVLHPFVATEKGWLLEPINKDTCIQDMSSLQVSVNFEPFGECISENPNDLTLSIRDK